jgi:hypothetical protein
MIQSVLFNKHLWSQEQARKYLIKHGFHDNGVDETTNEYRYRQHEPDSTKRYYTKTLRSGIEYIIMF